MSSTAVVPQISQVAPNLKSRPDQGAFAVSARLMFGAGAVGLLVSLVSLLIGKEGGKQFLHSYLVAYYYVLGLTIGAMFFVLVQHLTRAGWSVVVRRVAENVMGVMPIMLPLFLPIAIGYHDIWHHWVDAQLDPTKPGYDSVLAGKSAWLNVPFFFLRAAIYFAIWIGIAVYFRRTSIRQDQTGDPALTLRMARVAAPCMLLFALSVSFAAFDWLMALDPHWYSTMWGVYVFSGCFLSFMAASILLFLWLQSRGYLKDAVTEEHYHDMGKLMFAFIVFWAYTAFSQFMLIYYANIPEETVFYDRRMTGSWLNIGALLVLGHFLVPFAFMMSRHMKRARATIAIGASWMLLMHFVDLHYIVMPNLHSSGFHLSWVDLTTFIGMLGLFLCFVMRNIQNSPLVPERDPRLAESLHFHNI